MSVNLTINGQVFAYPEVEDIDWGTSATLWATAVTNGMLQKAGGTFTLLADVNFGATYGLVSQYYKSASSDISSSGELRLAQADSVVWRNAANDGDLALSLNSDVLEFDGTPLVISGLIVNADIASNAQIALSKLATMSTAFVVLGNASGVPTSTQVTGDISIDGLGAVAISTGVIVNADVNASAAIAYSKLALTGSIVNADVNASAAIAYSKLALTGSIVNADVNASAAIAGSKIAPQFGNQLVSGDREFQFTEISSPSTPATNKVLLYPKSDGNFYKMDDSGVEVEVGSGGSSGGGTLNIVDNPSAVSNTTGWTAATNYTVARDTSNSPLAGIIDSCFAVSTTTASSETSTSGVYAASLACPPAIRSTKLQLSVYVAVPSSNVGVWAVSVYNSGGTRVSLSTDVSGVTTLPIFTGQFTADLDADTGATYTVAFTQTTRSSANTLYYTNISIGNGTINRGAAIGAWTSYTPVFTGFGTATNIAFKWRQVGEEIEVRGSFTSGTTTAVVAQVGLPLSGLTFSEPGTVRLPVGSHGRATSSVNNGGYVLAKDGDTTFKFSFDSESTANDLLEAANADNFLASGQSFSFSGRGTISQWIGGGTVNLGANDVEYAYNPSVTDADTTGGFAYGPVGTSFGYTFTTTRSKRVGFLSPIQVTDQITFEVQAGTNAPWIAVTPQAGFFGPSLSIAAFTATTGLYLYPVSGSNTSIDVTFSQYRSGTNAWSTLTNYKWRVKKTRAGVATGFGVVQGTSSGLYPGNIANLDNEAATRMGLKSYAHGTTYNGGIAPTVTLNSGGGTLSSVTGTFFIPYQLQDSSWRMRFNLQVVLSTATRTDAVLSINGVVFVSTINQQIAGGPSANTTVYNALAIASADQLASNHASISTSTYRFSGDCALNAKPTWAY